MSNEAHLRAVAAAMLAQAAGIIAIANDIARGSDELLDASQVEARYPFKFRVVTDAAKRGEISIEHAGRKPLVRKSSLETWIASRPTRPTIAKIANDTDERAEVLASLARSAKRMGSK
jgi:hypothetical protein